MVTYPILLPGDNKIRTYMKHHFFLTQSIGKKENIILSTLCYLTDLQKQANNLVNFRVQRKKIIMRSDAELLEN